MGVQGHGWVANDKLIIIFQRLDCGTLRLCEIGFGWDLAALAARMVRSINLILLYHHIRVLALGLALSSTFIPLGALGWPPPGEVHSPIPVWQEPRKLLISHFTVFNPGGKILLGALVSRHHFWIPATHNWPYIWNVAAQTFSKLWLKYIKFYLQGSHERGLKMVSVHKSPEKELGKVLVWPTFQGSPCVLALLGKDGCMVATKLTEYLVGSIYPVSAESSWVLRRTYL